MSWAVMRTRLPALRTLPSSTWLTLSSRATSWTFGDLALEAEGGVARDDEEGRDLGEVGDDVLADPVGEILLLRDRRSCWRTAGRRSRACAARRRERPPARSAAAHQVADAGHDLAPVVRAAGRRSSRRGRRTGCGRRASGSWTPSTRELDQLVVRSRVSASDCTHCDFTASADQMTTTALAACSRSSITSA